ncbi:MAG TPA: Ig-like domain-containing protein [Chloroflexia bacterium]|nr:Ig-like domain-containing protein [Chloroflexia bacterium]
MANWSDLDSKSRLPHRTVAKRNRGGNTVPVRRAYGQMLTAAFALALAFIVLVAGGAASSAPFDTAKATSTPAATRVVPTPTKLPSPTSGAVSTPKGPHVKGITAGVGMRPGEIEGPVPVAVSFSEAMNQSSAQSAFSIAPYISGTFKWKQGNTLIFTPNAPLKPNTTYTVSVSTKARTSSGRYLVAAHTARFQTDLPPAIVRTLPTDGADEVPADAIVTVNFNRPMIPLTSLDNQPDVSKWVSIKPAVQGRWVWLGTAAVGFHPATGYLPATTYTVEVKAGWPDAVGVTLAQGTTFRFMTIKPAISSAEPYNSQKEVDLDAPVIVRFNMAMDRASVQGAFSLKRTDLKESLKGTYAWSPDSTVMTFTASSLLEFSKAYTAGITGPVKAATGNAAELVGGPTANSWTFTATDPTHVTSYSPYDYYNKIVQPASSFGFAFSNPLAGGQDVAKYLKIDPTPQGYVGQLEVGSYTVFTDGVKLLPNTTYNFNLEAGLKDKWGFPVAPYSWKVEVGPLPPGVAIKGGRFQPIYSEGPSLVRIEAANLDKVSLHLYQLDEAAMRDALRRESYCGPRDGNERFGTLKREWEVAVPPGENGTSTIYTTLGLSDGADRLPPGYYFLRADAPSPYPGSGGFVQSAAYLIVGRTGVVTKREGDDFLIWAADLGSGAPVPNYPLRIQQITPASTSLGPWIEQSGTTGADGVLRLKLNKAEDACLIAIWGEQAGDALAASTDWDRNIGSYSSYGSSSNGSAYRAGIYTDRPIYRPAQVVNFRGVYRVDDDASYTLPASGATVSVYASTYSDGDYTQVYTGTATLFGFGTFSGQFTLPANAPTGGYTLAFEPPGAPSNPNGYRNSAASVGFTVEEYRKPDFQVSVDTRGEVVHGEPLTATVKAGYYFGGPLANVTTTVYLWTNPYYFSWSDSATGESYTFGEYDYPYYYYYRPEPDYSGPDQSFEARTDANGQYVADVTRYVTTTNGSKSALIEGRVQDLSNQAVAGNSTLVVHQGLYYIGLRTSSYVAVASQPLTVSVRTVEWTGKRVQPNVPVKLTFARREWVAPTTPGGEWTTNDVPVGEASVTSDANGRATYVFTAPEAGDYQIVAESRDARGNVIRTSYQLWVSSRDPGYVPWRLEKEQQVELVADKEQYRVGETARILVTSPYAQATGLLTIERGHIRRYSIVNIQGGAPTIEVPLVDGDLPNVYVSLTLLGRERAPNGAPPDWANQVRVRQGYVNLSLDTSGKKLSVSIEPQGTAPFEPGSTITVTVRTRDVAGNPTSGEVSLAVVDEAIYALTGDNMPDLFEAFWGERSPKVSTSTSFSAGEDQRNLQPIPATGGGGPVAMPTALLEAAPTEGMPRSGGEEDEQQPKKVRGDFRDTAFWRATISTNKEGVAQVAVPFPDNLTTWRLTAHAITGDTRFGSKAETMLVTQPLLLRPVQPRFLTTGDNPHPQAVIHNNTAGTLQLEASLVVSGAVTLDPQPPVVQRLSVAPGAQVVVTWSLKVGKGDVANLRYWVRTFDKKGKDYREDAVAMSLPVKPFAAPEAVATSGEVTGTRADEGIFLPYTIDPLLGELVVQIAPSLAAAATDSVRYLKEYPYECSEQTTSRYLPLVVLDQVYKEQGRKSSFSAELPGIVERAFKRLSDLQHYDGGWGWWEPGESQWYNTAYVVQGLVAARDAGYIAPDNMLDEGASRLRQFLRDNSTQNLDETHRLNMRAYSLYVLSLATGADDDLQQMGKDLTAQLARLSTHARAWLAIALSKVGLKAESQKVLNSLIASARQSSTTAHWEETRPDYWSMGTDNRATALAVDALVTLAPNDPLVPKAVRWLMTAQREGHWVSTQETAISLIALSHYIRQSKELTADYKWQVSAFDKPLGSGVANSANLAQTVTLKLPTSQMPQNDLGNLTLTRNAAKGKMYYSVSLRYYVPGEGIKSRSEGMTITRSYYKVAGGVAGSAPIKEVRAGDLVKVRLTIAVPETSLYVLVTDPLPAGLEGVNGSLNTTSFTERPPNPMGTSIEDEGREPGGYYDWYWRWGPFSNVEMRDDRTVLFADYMGAGTYVYEYYARATTPGVYMGLPAHAEMLYYPDVFGHSDGGAFTVR